MHDSGTAASPAATAVAATVVPATDTTVASAAAAPVTMRTTVSSMAQVISAYTGADASAAATTAVPGVTAAGTGPASPATLAVSSMVSAMQQFDANGNPVGTPTLAAATPTLNLSAGQPAAATLAVAPALKLPGA